MDDKYSKCGSMSSKDVSDAFQSKFPVSLPTSEGLSETLAQKPLEHFFKPSGGETRGNRSEIDSAVVSADSSVNCHNPSTVYSVPTFREKNATIHVAANIICDQETFTIPHSPPRPSVIAHQIPLSGESNAGFLYTAPSTDGATGTKPDNIHESTNPPAKAIEARPSVADPIKAIDICVPHATVPPLSPGTKARIERNKRIALEKRAARLLGAACHQNDGFATEPRASAGFTFTSAGGSRLDVSAEAITAAHQLFCNSTSTLQPTSKNVTSQVTLKEVIKPRRSID